MVVFPNAKINLGLQIISKRPDGYHNIASCFYPIPFTDALEVVESKQFAFSTSGVPVPGNVEDNLCIKAYRLLADSYNLPPVAIHLHKHIPTGAGLGGGSADGAFMLNLLNQKFDLKIPSQQLEAYAAQLGSDCPFFIKNKPVFATETGTKFAEVSLSLSGYYVVLLLPRVHVSTTNSYAGVVPKKPDFSLQQFLENEPLNNWQTKVVNDFETTIFKAFPELQNLKKSLLNQGALYAAMTGSGSAVYGIFKIKPKLAKTNYPTEVMRL